MSIASEGRGELLKRLREQHQVGFKATQVLLKELQAIHKGLRQAMQSGPAPSPNWRSSRTCLPTRCCGTLRQ